MVSVLFVSCSNTNDSNTEKKKIPEQKVCTEYNMLVNLKDYLNFYAPNCEFIDFKPIMIDECTYDVRLKKKSNYDFYKQNYPNEGTLIDGKYNDYETIIVRVEMDPITKRYYVNDVGSYSHKWRCE